MARRKTSTTDPIDDVFHQPLRRKKDLEEAQRLADRPRRFSLEEMEHLIYAKQEKIRAQYQAGELEHSVAIATIRLYDSLLRVLRELWKVIHPGNDDRPWSDGSDWTVERLLAERDWRAMEDGLAPEDAMDEPCETWLGVRLSRAQENRRHRAERAITWAPYPEIKPHLVMAPAPRRARVVEKLKALLEAEAHWAYDSIQDWRDAKVAADYLWVILATGRWPAIDPPPDPDIRPGKELRDDEYKRLREVWDILDRRVQASLDLMTIELDGRPLWPRRPPKVRGEILQAEYALWEERRERGEEDGSPSREEFARTHPWLRLVVGGGEEES